MKRFLLFLLVLLLFTASFGSVLSGKVIVLDPGHGGIDNGAKGPTGLLEKTVNLEVALDLEKILRAQGATVYMTRTSDKYVYLEDRIRLANEKHADLFVCIHQNSLKNYPDFDEVEVYYWNEDDTSKIAASCFGKSVGRILDLRWKVKRNDFKVLRIAKVPAVLVESCYISCVARENWLRKPSNLWKEALALDDGILSYFEKIGGETK